MNNTPRLRSAYPLTPRHNEQPNQQQGEAATSRNKRSNTNVSVRREEESRPLIPFSILDAPTQRLYVSAFYLGLTAWRFYDYYALLSDDNSSVTLFSKWIMIDAIFLFGLPELRVPWLEWSATTIAVVYGLHAIVNAFLMFRLPMPFETGLVALMRMLYDRELAVSERRVKPGSLLHNTSLILGKQIVHILPEGSAMLNPEQRSFCVDATHTFAELPILVNQSAPAFMELLRLDLDTGANETITISSKEVKKLVKQADKGSAKKDSASSRVLRYSVKQTGSYRLAKVVDDSNLEVQVSSADALVVPCPSAQIKIAHKDRCRGDLSDVKFEVAGTPPLKVRYSKRVNEEDKSDVFLTVHPTDSGSFVPLANAKDSLVRLDDNGSNVSWARTHHATVPINETLGTQGWWEYSIDEVHDAVGNIVRYPDNMKGKSAQTIKTAKTIEVHEPPKVLFEDCSAQKPLRIAQGDSVPLPIWLNPSMQQDMTSLSHKVTYMFASGASEDPKSEELSRTQDVTLRHGDRGPRIQEPGIYTLTSVSNQYCVGQVLEPSSCLLLNPPEPEISISSETIPHQCAGNSVGLRLNLDLIGTPPFRVLYTSRHENHRPERHSLKVDSLRTQLELKPKDPGHYSYEFSSISDAVYQNISPSQHSLKFETDVKPPASAHFVRRSPLGDACIDEEASLDVELVGEAPFSLEYDIVHAGKRKNYKEGHIPSETFTITTPKLDKGGQHVISLTSISDQSGCKIFQREEAIIQVRHQRPSAGFGLVEGQRSLLTLEDRKAFLPLRLSGKPPFTVSFSRLGHEGSFDKTFRNTNDELGVESQATYVIEAVKDSTCPGLLEPNARYFEVQWVPRPTLQVVQSSSIEKSGPSLSKLAVCEGDQDSTDITFTGNSPYHLEYDVHSKPDRGAASVNHRSEDVALHGTSIRMETSQPGRYQYRFTSLGDRSYDSSVGSFTSSTINQRIHSRPSAKFTNLGKTYSYCKEQTSVNDFVPISLAGQPPFSIELSIRHHSSTTPEILNIPNIHEHHYDFHIPQRALSLGTHSLAIRKIRDANGCESRLDPRGPMVRVNVVDVPSISPLEPHTDYCVGDRISFTLAGTPPFNIYYLFEGAERKASSSTTAFRRLAERAGNFTVTAISDKVSGDSCRSRSQIVKSIHPLPSVRMSRGRVSEVDIHEGGEAELLFEFEGTPPFEFTYTRSTTATRGKKSIVLETKSDLSEENTKSIKVSDEGTYEVVSIRDRFCGVTAQGIQGRTSQQLLAFK